MPTIPELSEKLNSILDQNQQLGFLQNERDNAIDLIKRLNTDPSGNSVQLQQARAALRWIHERIGGRQRQPQTNQQRKNLPVFNAHGLLGCSGELPGLFPWPQRRHQENNTASLPANDPQPSNPAEPETWLVFKNESDISSAFISQIKTVRNNAKEALSPEEYRMYFTKKYNGSGKMKYRMSLQVFQRVYKRIRGEDCDIKRIREYAE